MLEDFVNHEIGSPNAFTKPELIALMGLPHFMSRYYNKRRSQPIALLGGLCLDFYLKSAEKAQLGFAGDFYGGATYEDPITKLDFNGQEKAAAMIDLYLEWPLLISHKDYITRLAVIETDLAYVIFSCWSNEFNGEAFHDLIKAFAWLFGKIYADNGEDTLYDSVGFHLSDGIHGICDILDAYWDDSPECTALRASWDLLPEGEILGRFGERLFEITE
ncbi:hypothetical protein FWF89_00330 [Candidatus Saccharibacteria bacterium]|nr:hypothetical protein [Candidatus Saccharibacteria bacterium]